MEKLMSTRSRHASVTLAVAVALAGAAAVAQTAKIDYVSGGVTLEERFDLASRGTEFNLKVVTAAERSGAYLADVQMKVIDSRDAKVVVETTMDGPWFLAQLPPGTYVLEATFEGKKLTKTVAIPKDGRREAYFYWTIAGLQYAPER
jgi:hypothetical protein